MEAHWDTRDVDITLARTAVLKMEERARQQAIDAGGRFAVGPGEITVWPEGASGQQRDVEPLGAIHYNWLSPEMVEATIDRLVWNPRYDDAERELRRALAQVAGTPLSEAWERGAAGHAAEPPAPAAKLGAVAIFARVRAPSATSDADLEHEVDVCRRWAEARGGRVARVIREVDAGAGLTGRPPLADLRDAIRRHAVDAVLVTSLDRLTEDAGSLAILVDEASVAGVAIVDVDAQTRAGPGEQAVR